MSMVPGVRHRLAPSFVTGTDEDRHAAGEARRRLDQAIGQVHVRTDNLHAAVRDLKRLDRTGFLDVAVFNLQVAEEDLDGALAELQDAVVAAATLSARTTADTVTPRSPQRPSPLLLGRRASRPLSLVDTPPPG